MHFASGYLSSVLSEDSVVALSTAAALLDLPVTVAAPTT